MTVVAHADGSGAVRFLSPFVCVSVCFFLCDISKTDATLIAKLDVQMFHDES